MACIAGYSISKMPREDIVDDNEAETDPMKQVLSRLWPSVSP